MKSRLKFMWIQLFSLIFILSVAHAQTAQPPAQPPQVAYTQPELEQMLAPIALYPDVLLSQILMASTYPTEVVEASYWVKANPGLKGEAAVKAAKNQSWDISVKSLLPFPQVLGTMETKLDWTEKLGNAFLGQEQQVMDTVQLLRQKAMAAGYLKSDNRVRVAVADKLVSIELVQPTAVYVPYYNPTVVYGTWWAPAYAPIYWDPWPGYAVAPGYYGWAWAPVATIVTVGILYGAFNWRSHSVYYGRNVSYWRGHSSYSHYRYSGSGPARWSHDATHRRDVPYRGATVNQRYGHKAAAYNAKVGPRPTTQDIRSGKSRVTTTTTTRTATSRTGTVARSTTTRTGTGTKSTAGRSNTVTRTTGTGAARSGATRTGTTTRTTTTANTNVRTRTGAAPRSAAPSPKPAVRKAPDIKKH